MGIAVEKLSNETLDNIVVWQVLTVYSFIIYTTIYS